MELCDLHTHSHFSDGSCTPAQLMALAKEKSLEALALTDHNCVDGLPDFLEAAKDSGIQPICGAEFSVELEGKELHLLGLFIAPKHFEEISKRMNEVQLKKEQSNLALANALMRAGYHIDYNVMKAATPNGKLNRAHFATALWEKGYVSSTEEAFKTILCPQAGYYKAPERLQVYDVIDWLRQLGAVPVLAHPFLRQTPRELEEFLPKAKAAGLIGMETRYTEYSPETTVLAGQMAQAFGLLPSGGSDFHGSAKPDIQIGTGWGDLEVPFRWVSELEAHAG